MTAIIAIITCLVGLCLGYFVRIMISKQETSGAEQQAKRAMTDAKREAGTLMKEAELEVKAQQLKAKEEFDTSTESRRAEIKQIEERMGQRETNLDRKVSLLDKKEASLEQKLSEAEERRLAFGKEQEELEHLIDEEKEKLQRVAALTQEEARRALMRRIEKDMEGEMATFVRRRQEEAKAQADRDSKKIVALAIQRYSGSHSHENMTSTVALPSDEMKGRVIGREGRNIRAIEAATGVNLLIDDTPEAVVVTAFDPVRREIAKQALEELVADGRIHPARIEEVVAKVEENMEETIRHAGEEAAYEVGAQNVDPEIIRTLGRLKFRTSYSQNVLSHSVEVAQIMGMIAGELGLDVSVAKRVGLFHDIGKALDHKVEGPHALIGADLLRRCGESSDVVHGVAAHHNEVEQESLYPILASASDAISGSRPGARSETTEIYIKRLERIEAIANNYEGVKKSYAVHAGREVRVFVEPSKIDENEALMMARNISKQIEDELQFPGEIRVMVIRETRCVEYAR
jgi:ribonuclease Y